MCGEDIHSSMRILAYDEGIADATSAEYAKVKHIKVIEAMKVFSDPRFNIDVLKVVPVNVSYVEGFGEKGKGLSIVVKKLLPSLKEQEEATNLPLHPYLSAGVSASSETLEFAHASGANFNGCSLLDDTTWAGSVEAYIKDGEAAAREWLIQKVVKY